MNGTKVLFLEEEVRGTQAEEQADFGASTEGQEVEVWTVWPHFRE